MAILTFANLTFHSAALASGVYYAAWVYRNMHPNYFSGHGAFLTQWSHFLENILLFILLVDDLRALFGSKGGSRWQKFVDGYFSIMFTLTTMVGVLFWSIYFYNRDMILPASLDKIYPSHVNMYQHGVVAVWMWIEAFIRRHGNIEPRKLDICLAPGLGLLYLAWSVVVATMSEGRWPYPFQRTWPAYVLIALYVLALTATTLFVVLKRATLRFAESAVHSRADPGFVYGPQDLKTTLKAKLK